MCRCVLPRLLVFRLLIALCFVHRSRRVTFDQFVVALTIVAEKKFPQYSATEGFNRVVLKIVESGGPATHATVAATGGIYVRPSLCVDLFVCLRVCVRARKCSSGGQPVRLCVCACVCFSPSLRTAAITPAATSRGSTKTEQAVALKAAAAWKWTRAWLATWCVGDARRR